MNVEFPRIQKILSYSESRLYSLLRSSSAGDRFIRGVFWSLAASIVAQGLGVVGSILAGRILGQAGFGELSVIRNTVVTFGVFAGSGLQLACTKYVAEHRDADHKYLGRLIGSLMNIALIIGGVVAALCFVFAKPVATFVLNAGHLDSALRLGSILLLTGAINGVQMGALSGFEAFGSMAKVTALDGALSVLLIPLGASIWGVWGAMGGFVAASVISLPVKGFVLSRICRHIPRVFSEQEWGKGIQSLWQFVLPALLVNMCTLPFEWVTRLILVRQPNGFAELGVFTAAYTWTQLVIFLPVQVSTPATPILTNLLAKNDIHGAGVFIRKTQSLAWILAVLAGIPIFFLSKTFMSAYGSSFRCGSGVLSVLAVSYMVSSGVQITRSFFVAASKMWWHFAQTLIWGVLLVSAALYLSRFGAQGLAWSYMAAYIIFTASHIITQERLLSRLKAGYGRVI